MTRIQQKFISLKETGKKALIPYIMAGDPNPHVTVPLLHKLVEHGADIIELGMPFSDPMADGETISLAAERAIRAGTGTRRAIQMVKEFRRDNQHTPILLMGYLNPIEIIGYDSFINQCHDAGVDGLLLVDLPPHETNTLKDKLANNNMNQIFLLAPTTGHVRREQILANGSGFIYYVSLKGVTGAANIDTDDVSLQIANIQASTDLPVCVGFGIRDAASVKAVGTHADGVIVGSELVKNYADIDAHDMDAINTATETLLAKIDELRVAVDSLTISG